MPEDTVDVRQISSSTENEPSTSAFQLKPNYSSFKTSEIKEIILSVLSETLTGKTYDCEEAKKWTQVIANKVGLMVKDLQMEQYKTVTQVLLGQQLGSGAKYIGRCRWDSETDNYTSATFGSQSLFCVVTVFGVYLY